MAADTMLHCYIYEQRNGVRDSYELKAPEKLKKLMNENQQNNYRPL